MRAGELLARFVAGALCLETIRDAVVRGRAVYRATGGEKNRGGNAHRALVREQHVVGPVAVIVVLVNVVKPRDVSEHFESV